jgi:hypothetical protein
MAKQKKIASSKKKTIANRKNAKRCTGPQSTTGKAIAKLNAVIHGLGCAAPVALGEKVEEWEIHRSAMIAAIAPIGALEMEFAERVASLTWRLRRVTRYETAVATVEEENAAAVVDAVGESCSIVQTRTREIIRKELDAATENLKDVTEMRDGYRRLQTAPADEHLDGPEAFDLLFNATGYTPYEDEYAFDVTDREFLGEIGVPPDWRDKPQSYSGWSAQMVMKGMQAIAQEDGMTAEALVDQAIRESDKAMEEYAADVRRLEAELAALPAAVVVISHAAVSAPAQRVAFPNQNAIDKVTRYENHLSKQLFLALNLLDRMQSDRRCPPPVSPGSGI